MSLKYTRQTLVAIGQPLICSEYNQYQLIETFKTSLMALLKVSFGNAPSAICG